MLWANYVLLPFEIGLASWLAFKLHSSRLYRRVPLFTVYVGYSILALTARLAAMPVYSTYYYVYWGTEGPDIVLGLAAAYQCFLSVYRGMLLLPWVRWLFPLTAAGISIYSLWETLSRPLSHISPAWALSLVSVIVGVEIWFQCLIGGTFLIFVFVKHYLRSSRPTFESDVVLGFGIASLGMLLAMLVRSKSGTKVDIIATWAGSVAYIVALFVWIISSRSPSADEARPDGQGVSAQFALQELEKYASALRKK